MSPPPLLVKNTKLRTCDSAKCIVDNTSRVSPPTFLVTRPPIAQKQKEQTTNIVGPRDATGIVGFAYYALGWTGHRQGKKTEFGGLQLLQGCLNALELFQHPRDTNMFVFFLLAFGQSVV